ncbi:MAG: DUF2958 domain-containing protein [Marivivens sp.]|nr:DUF2958 domain-containing protein [Marivivens sp.]
MFLGGSVDSIDPLWYNLTHGTTHPRDQGSTSQALRNFGLCDLGYGAEWGYVSLAELESVSLPFGMGIERDIYFQPKPATEVM